MQKMLTSNEHDAKEFVTASLRSHATKPAQAFFQALLFCTIRKPQRRFVSSKAAVAQKDKQARRRVVNQTENENAVH
jgi:hypothetical protein